MVEKGERKMSTPVTGPVNVYEAEKDEAKNAEAKNAEAKNAEAKNAEAKKADVVDLGPLEPLLHDPTISDLLVNGAKEVYIERAGVLEESGMTFKDNAHLMHIIDQIVSAIGRRVDESSPMVDARLADGSRVNVVIPPLAIDGPHLSIRRFLWAVYGGKLALPVLLQSLSHLMC
jgi:Flp pilus assembly CpaF family ATPase